MKRLTPLTIAIFDVREPDLRAADLMVWQHCKKEGVPVEIRCYTDEQKFFENVSSQYFRAVFVAVRGTEDFHTAWRVRDYDKDCALILIADDGEFALLSYRLNDTQYIVRPLDEEKIARAITAITAASKANHEND